jgi:hypothetical protein
MNMRSSAHISNRQRRVATIELGAIVTLDGRQKGVLVGRSFDAKNERMVYDVRLPADKTILNVTAQRVKAAGPGRCDVIGRDVAHNPKRPHLIEEMSGRFVA